MTDISYDSRRKNLAAPESRDTLSSLAEAVRNGAKGEEVIEMVNNIKKAQYQERHEAALQESRARQDRLNALGHALNLARSKHSGSGTDYINSLQGARIAEARGNRSPILQEALDKHDGRRIKLPSSSIYMTSADEQSYYRSRAEKGNIYAIPNLGSFLEDNFMRSFHADPSSTRRIHRAGEGRTESEEKIRGGILLLAEQYKTSGDIAGLTELRERISNDPKLLATLKKDELHSTFSPESQHLPKQARPVSLETFKQSFEKLRNNHPELSQQEFLELATHNLKSKNYSSFLLTQIGKLAWQGNDQEMAGVILAVANSKKTAAVQEV